MNADQVQALVQAVESRPQPSVKLMPGTIAAMGTGVAGVVMDGDPDGTSLDASLLFADVGEGDRVMVLFDPPQGVYVVGTIGRAHEAGTVIARYQTNNYPGLVAVDDDTTTVASDRFMVHFGRRYRLRLDLFAEFADTDPDAVVLASTSINLPLDPQVGNSIRSVSSYVTDTFGGFSEYVALDLMLVPTATFVSDVIFDVTAQNGRAELRATFEVTDVGPAPSQS
jgi:hypothetical protein